MKKYDIFYVITGVIIIGLIINLWITYLYTNDATMISVYVGFVTALILAMKNATKESTYRCCRILAWCMIMLIIIVFFVSLMYNGAFKNNDFAYKIIRSAGFCGTLGTFFINWNRE
ncbi:hypothetical protein [Enterocloster clostridioformis]|uniref:hypothetical protein n=1 Tax=Enterocloster clostridioformis TaxID=1531 RepID=UPI00048033B3|nr:hypothetical protein [Enterocloster clostridioformis]